MTQTITFPFDRRPEPGEAMPVAEGVRWVRMPMPLAGLDHINLWLVEDGDGWTVVDTGVKTDQIQELWENVFTREIGGKPVKRVICTHFHIDHTGMAGWITQRFPGIELWMTFGEWSFARMLWLEALPEVPEHVLEFYRRSGFGAEAIEQIKSSGYANMQKQSWEVPRAFRRMTEGDVIRIGQHDWKIMIGRGHSPEHACLYCPALNVLISGDQVLPRISPHIGLHANEPEGNPLGLYLNSLKQFNSLPSETLVLPAHNDPFVGVGARADQLAHHHAVRLGLLGAAMEDWTPMPDVLPVLFRRQLEGFQRIMASSEALAHLQYMVVDGTAQRRLDADGVYQFRRATTEIPPAEIGHE